MVMFDEDIREWFPFYQTKDPMTINEYNTKFLTNRDKEVLDILNKFRIMSSNMMVELDKNEDTDKQIGGYLCKSGCYLGLPTLYLTFSNYIYIFWFYRSYGTPNN